MKQSPSNNTRLKPAPIERHASAPVDGKFQVIVDWDNLTYRGAGWLEKEQAKKNLFKLHNFHLGNCPGRPRTECPPELIKKAA